jgi:iron complex transport system ATP-binding protein
VTVVELDSITLARGGKTILDGVSWSIARGDHALLLGANGSGKTTLLKVLTGYEWPTSGRVCVLGREYGECDLRALRRRMGWVSSAMEHRVPPEDGAERVTASGFDASFGLYRPLSDEERAKSRMLVEKLGLARLGRQPFGLMSQGEQKRVLIARALVHDPALLVLDEPCAGLDPAARSDFLDDVGRFAAIPDGPTIVFVTHHVEEVRPWVRRALALREGKAVAEGGVQTVLNSVVLSRVFGRVCRLEGAVGEYSLGLGPVPVDQPV